MASREAVMQRYRTEVLSEVVNQFRSRFGVTVPFGYASLTRPEHAPSSRDHSHMRPLVHSLSIKHAPCRRTHAGTRCLRRSCDRHPFGPEV